MLFWKLWDDLLRPVLPEIVILTFLGMWPRHFAKNPGKAFVFRAYNKLPPSEREEYSFERLRLTEKILFGAWILLLLVQEAVRLYKMAAGAELAGMPAMTSRAVGNAILVLSTGIIVCALAKFPLALFRKKQGTE